MLVTLREYWQWQPDDVLIHALPIFHVHGLFVAIHGALINGSKMLWLSKFDPKLAISKFPEATVFMGVPTLYVRMLAEPTLTKAQAAHMRLFISGSAPLLIETFSDWQQCTGHTILERYGMSETVMLTSNPCGPDPRYGGATERRGGTVGFPLPGVSLRVMEDDGKAVKPARSAASRSKARTCSRVTGACPKRPPRNSPPTASSRPAMSARWTSAATSPSSAAART
jgi:malonyl-CoA/methylmalonyl-CoA synthetase